MRSHPGTLSRVPQRRRQRPRLRRRDRRPAGPEGGGWLADLDPGWDVGGGILNGGYLLAVAARAAVAGQPAPAPGRAVGQLPAGGAGRARRRSRSRPGPAGRTLAHSLGHARRRRRGPCARRPGDDGHARRTTPPATRRADARHPAGRRSAVDPPRTRNLAPPGWTRPALTRAGRHPPGPGDRRLGDRASRRASRCCGPGCGSPTAGEPDPLGAASPSPTCCRRRAGRDRAGSAGRRRCSCRCSSAPCRRPGWCLVEARGRRDRRRLARRGLPDLGLDRPAGRAEPPARPRSRALTQPGSATSPVEVALHGRTDRRHQRLRRRRGQRLESSARSAP